MIDLPPDQLAILRRILAEHAPGCEVRVFGSRVNGRAKPYSDLDLALVGTGKIDGAQLARLREALDESTIPIRVDVLDWHAISENFRSIIAAGYEVLGT